MMGNAQGHDAVDKEGACQHDMCKKPFRFLHTFFHARRRAKTGGFGRICVQ